MFDTKIRGLNSRSQAEPSLVSGCPSALSVRVGTAPGHVQNGSGPVTSTARVAITKHNESPFHTTPLTTDACGNRVIGIVVPHITNNFFAGVIAGVEEMAGREKYTTIICQSSEHLDKEKAAVKMLIDQNVSCIIISLSAETAATQVTNHLKKAIAHKIKVIQFDRVDETLQTDCVVNDIDAVTGSIVSHLVGEGYKNIACMSGPKNIDIFRKRKEAFDKHIQMMGMPFVNSNIAFYDLTMESAREAAKKLLSLPDRPDAIVASTDLGALAVWEVAQEMGLAMPKDLGLCGFSNEYYTELVSPNITSADQLCHQMGRDAARIFFDSIRGENGSQTQPRTVTVLPQLIVRASTKRLL